MTQGTTRECNKRQGGWGATEGFQAGLSDKISLGRTVRKRVNRKEVKQRVWELGGPAPCLGSWGEEREGQDACRVQQEGAVVLHDASQGPKVCCTL